MSAEPNTTDMTRWALQIEGMTCGRCVARVQAALGALDGVEALQVTLEPGLARLALPAAATPEGQAAQRASLIALVQDAGYEVLDAQGPDSLTFDSSEAPSAQASPEAADSPQPDASGCELRLQVKGMTCASCVSRVERALAQVQGSSQIKVNFATEVASLRLPGAQPDAQALARVREAVEGAGYQIERVLGAGAQDASADGQPAPEAAQGGLKARLEAQARAWRARWIFGLAMTPPIMIAQMGPMWLDVHLTGALEVGRLLLVAYLTALVMGYTGRGFFEGAWAALKHRSATMDTLVALGAGVAFVASLGLTAAVAWGRLRGHVEVYHDSAAMILTLIAVGKWLEARARGQAGAALEAIMGLGAKHATVQRQGQWLQVPASQVLVGDLMRVLPGEKIPTDGVIVEGQAAVDEAMMTGESAPVRRGPDEEVFGASLNVDGALLVRATRVGAQTALAQIARQVEQAQSSKADIQRLVDRVSAVFVPVILLIALLTWGAWMARGDMVQALLPAIAVLVVACPCALGLATPTAMMVGTALSARQGIIIREANALERARALDVILFDKTGTLTQGKMQVKRLIPAPGVLDQELLRLAASLEGLSAHPIAKAVARHAQERGLEALPVEQMESIAGDGLRGRVKGRALAVGKVAWLSAERALPAELERELMSARDEGHTVIGVADEASFLGLIALRDEPKPEAAQVVRELTARGVEVWMVTGDDPRTAASVARELGVPPERVRAGVVPSQKAQIVRQARGPQGRVVAMVGDGINDAPALAEADLGVALGSGADVAMEAADITLVGDSLTLVLRAVDLARATAQKIRQNLFWAFIYNVVLVPVAALGLLTPALAAGAMALSSVSVVSSSLLLGRRRALA